MGGAYDNRYEFPVRMLNEEILEVIRDKRPEDTSLLELADLEKAKYELASHQKKKGEALNPDEHITWLEFYETRGYVEELDNVLKKYKVPFDRWCSAAEGNNPDILYYRPDMNLERVIPLTIDGEEYMLMSDVKRMMQSPNTKYELERYLAECTSEGIPDIYSYAHETPLGRDKKMVEAISKVLEAFDHDELTQDEALQKIAEIRSGANAEQDRDTPTP